MIVYSVSGGGEATSFYSSSREACQIARAQSRGDDLTISVERCVLVPMTRGNVLRILNQLGGYVAEAETVAEFRDGKLITGGAAR